MVTSPRHRHRRRWRRRPTCIGAQPGGRCGDTAPHFCAGGQALVGWYAKTMEDPDFNTIKTHLKPGFFLKSVGTGLSALQLFNLPPGMYIFLKKYVPNAETCLPHFAAYTGFKRVKRCDDDQRAAERAAYRSYITDSNPQTSPSSRVQTSPAVGKKCCLR